MDVYIKSKHDKIPSGQLLSENWGFHHPHPCQKPSTGKSYISVSLSQFLRSCFNGFQSRLFLLGAEDEKDRLWWKLSMSLIFTYESIAIFTTTKLPCSPQLAVAPRTSAWPPLTVKTMDVNMAFLLLKLSFLFCHTHHQSCDVGNDVWFFLNRLYQGVSVNGVVWQC